MNNLKHFVVLLCAFSNKRNSRNVNTEPLYGNITRDEHPRNPLRYLRLRMGATRLMDNLCLSPGQTVIRPVAPPRQTPGVRETSNV
jgi:hypothetical protein